MTRENDRLLRIADQLSRLRDPLTSMVSRLDPGLPDCLPILGAALRSQGPDPRLPPRPDGTAPEALPLSALLSRVLLVGHLAALPDGAAPRRLSRRQLTPLAHS